MKIKNSKSLYAYPYVVWSAIFIIIPLLMVVYYSFTQEVDGKVVFTLANFKEVLDPIYINVFVRSILISGLATLICLIVGYPVAYLITKAPLSRRGTLIVLFILPMWMNFLLRTYAWAAILGQNGLLSSFLGIFGITYHSILYTPAAVLVGMVYDFLPFMVLPIYTSLCKMDHDLIDAAYDLGAGSFTVFRKIILPLSMPGVFSGITMVFMPSVTSFAISRILGGGKTMLVGDLIEQQFTVVGDWNFGSAISIFLMIVILISMRIMSRMDDGKGEGGMII
ncbi:ABC transporter permease [Peptacetobacter hominis]|uniref:ABC transporter permease n=1 Tax=Peptacetobacter hominis TaxID=2743610 RepID=A0A544QVV5_9FIRM|nr:ABC transporter permease [Peptacetobacter hominis]TQQ84821.1 ABC transporter permease [Peptacetobacter hominis]